MNLNDYMKDNFPNLYLRPPLFYNWDCGLRFELGNPHIRIYKDQNRAIINYSYFNEALQRAKKLFEASFKPEDKVFCLFQKYSRGKQKIKKRDYCYRYIKNFDKIESFNTTDVFDLDDIDYKSEHYHRIVFHTTVKHIDYVNILNRSIFYDFGGKALDNYFINRNQNIIFHLYDDRGLDMIAKDKHILQKIYLQYGDWLLDYDRDKIDSNFKNL